MKFMEGRLAIMKFRRGSLVILEILGGKLDFCRCYYYLLLH
jgi:hypothetical protein